MTGYARRGLGETFSSPAAEICASGHCNYFVWGAGLCQAAWSIVNAYGGPEAYCRPLTAPPPVQQQPPVLMPAPAPIPVAVVPAPPAELPPPLVVTEWPPEHLPPFESLAWSPSCPAEYPIGHVDPLGQVICERPRGLELIPVAVQYGAERVAVGAAAGNGVSAASAPAAEAGYVEQISAPVANTAAANGAGLGIPWPYLLGGTVVGVLALQGLVGGRR